MEEVIREYLLAEKQGAKIFIPMIGSISTHHRPPRQGRDMYTGRLVEMPERYSLRFVQTKPSDGDNTPFFTWIVSRYESNLSIVEKQLIALGELIRSELDVHCRFQLGQIGEFLLKRRPPRYRLGYPNYELTEVPAHAHIILVPQQSLLKDLDKESETDPSYFDALPNQPFAIPEGLSSFCLDQIPSPSQWWKTCRTLAVLEPDRYTAIASLEPGLNYAAMSNGQGDECKIFFTERDTLILGFAHESPMACWGGAQQTWPGIFDGLPKALRERLFHNYMEAEPVSFCIWHCADSGVWHKGNIEKFPSVPSDDPDGSAYLFNYFPFEPHEYLGSSPEADVTLVKEIYNRSPPIFDYGREDKLKT